MSWTSLQCCAIAVESDPYSSAATHTHWGDAVHLHYLLKQYLLEGFLRCAAGCFNCKVGAEYVAQLGPVAIPSSGDLLLLVVVVGGG